MAKRTVSFDDLKVGMKLTANDWSGGPMEIVEKRSDSVLVCTSGRIFPISRLSVDGWGWFEVEKEASNV
jgi:hypothetical protein